MVASLSLVNHGWDLCPQWGPGICLDPTQPLPPAPKICVEKCPSRYLTYLNAHRSQDFEYYKQFCVPGLQNTKVRRARAAAGGWCRPEELTPLFWQGVAEVLRDGDCPAVLIPSKPRESGVLCALPGCEVVVGAQPDRSHPLLHAVAQRCFPAIHAHKGTLMVGNETTYEDGQGSRKNITELVEGAK